MHHAAEERDVRFKSMTGSQIFGAFVV